MRSQNLQRLFVAERDEDLDPPLVVVDFLREPDLSDEAESWVRKSRGQQPVERSGDSEREGRTLERARELRADFVDKVFELRKPLALQTGATTSQRRKKKDKGARDDVPRSSLSLTSPSQGSPSRRRPSPCMQRSGSPKKHQSKTPRSSQRTRARKVLTSIFRLSYLANTLGLTSCMTSSEA